MTLRSGLIIFVLGGLSLTLCDRVHIHFGVLEQANRSVGGQAIWVFPMFGTLSLAVVHGYGWLRRFMGEQAHESSLATTAVAAVFAIGAYASTGPLDSMGSTLMTAFALAWIIRIVMRSGRTPVVFCLILAVLGPLGEVAMSALGTFHYLHPDLGSVPIWLPGIYLHGGLLASEVEAWLVERGRSDEN